MARGNDGSSKLFWLCGSRHGSNCIVKDDESFDDPSGEEVRSKSAIITLARSICSFSADERVFLVEFPEVLLPKTSCALVGYCSTGVNEKNESGFLNVTAINADRAVRKSLTWQENGLPHGRKGSIFFTHFSGVIVLGVLFSLISLKGKKRSQKP